MRPVVWPERLRYGTPLTIDRRQRAIARDGPAFLASVLGNHNDGVRDTPTFLFSRGWDVEPL